MPLERLRSIPTLLAPSRPDTKPLTSPNMLTVCGRPGKEAF